MSELDEVFEGEILGEFVSISEYKDDNTIAFALQEGPIGEVGVNGCQVDAIVVAARKIIQHFNKKFPCRENSIAITKLQEAEMWLTARLKDRIARGVEGKNEA